MIGVFFFFFQISSSLLAVTTEALLYKISCQEINSPCCGIFCCSLFVQTSDKWGSVDNLLLYLLMISNHTELSSCDFSMFQVTQSQSKENACTRNIKYEQLNFVLDSIYGITITAVPSLVILFLNIPILRRLLNWDRERTKSRLVLKENKIRLEFTVIMLAISSCFIGLNLPYFITWCKQFRQSLNPGTPTQADRLSGELYITKTIFCINYCINFFVYCITGAYYRREIRSMFKYYLKRKNEKNNKDIEEIPDQLDPSTNDTTSSLKCFCLMRWQQRPIANRL